MIFVTVGSQKFQFNRLLIEIDRLVEDGIITEEVFAQTGYSDYEPRNYKYKKFLDRDEFSNIIYKSDKVITHGGTGAIIGAVKLGKIVIAVPRLAKYGEHVDDHQTQLIDEFTILNFIESVYNIDEIGIKYKSAKKNKYSKYKSNTENIILSIEEFLKKC